MLPKSVIAFVAASAFATGALMPTAGGCNRGPGNGRPMLKAGICRELPAGMCR
jgi:hypothetical protein